MASSTPSPVKSHIIMAERCSPLLGYIRVISVWVPCKSRYMLCWSAVAAGGDIRFWAEMPVNEQPGSPDRVAANASSRASRFMISAPFH